MTMPAITVLLCTVRPDKGYLEKPNWHILGKVVDDLNKQTFRDFELIVVDGVPQRPGDPMGHAKFDCKRVPPRDTLWTRNRKVAISTYRNTGLSHARGELVVNLDDCCELPEIFLEVYARAWEKYRVCAAMTWPESGDCRSIGRVDRPGSIFGFGSYPLVTALDLNGYDEAYDGGQGLEDVDWSTRCFMHGVQQALVRVPGFLIHPQTAHDPMAIDLKQPFVKCCNSAWQAQRVKRSVMVANVKELWEHGEVGSLVGPCKYLARDGTCDHHGNVRACAYMGRGWVEEFHPLCAKFLEEENWPVIDLAAEREKNRDEA